MKRDFGEKKYFYKVYFSVSDHYIHQLSHFNFDYQFHDYSL